MSESRRLYSQNQERGPDPEPTTTVSLRKHRPPHDSQIALLTLHLRGHKLVIEASGSFTDEVEKGAYINLSVKYGVITLVRTKADLCEQMQEVDKDCPLEGDQEIRKEVDIPKEIPPV